MSFRLLLIASALLAVPSCLFNAVPPPPSFIVDGGSPINNTPSPITGTEEVLQHHGNAQRTGQYVASNFTRIELQAMHQDPNFSVSLSGPIYAQPLYVQNAVGGKDALMVATEQNVVFALDATTGAVLWQTPLGTPAARANLPCGNITPLGVTGTPVVDAASGTLFVDAMTTPDNGVTLKHQVFALSVATGSVLAGWPVDLSKVASGATTFNSTVQNQRGALLFLNDTVYVPFGGHNGDCGDYRGWVIGIPRQHPESPRAWATSARGGGIWAPGGLASDGTSIFAATGNTFGAMMWSGGEAIIRFAQGPAFSGQPVDYFTPTDWMALDAGDVDIGGSGPLLINVPGATPSNLIVSLGKNGKIYLLDQSNLGGVNDGLASAHVSSKEIINAATSYTTGMGTYVVFNGPGTDCPNGQSGDLTALRIGTDSPPSISTAWCAATNGMGSPIVTTTDGANTPIIWNVGAENDNRLHGFDADNGIPLYQSEPLPFVRRFQTPIVAKGRIFVATDSGVVAFTTR